MRDFLYFFFLNFSIYGNWKLIQKVNATSELLRIDDSVFDVVHDKALIQIAIWIFHNKAEDHVISGELVLNSHDTRARDTIDSIDDGFKLRWINLEVIINASNPISPINRSIFHLIIVELQHFFFPIDKEQKTVVVEVSDVTRVDPAVDDGLR